MGDIYGDLNVCYSRSETGHCRKMQTVQMKEIFPFKSVLG